MIVFSGERHQLQVLSTVAIDAARRAAEIISSYRNIELDVRTKGEGTRSSTVVTDVDLKAQAAVVDALMASMATYDLALLAEETSDDGERLKKKAFWCVDPLDGTLPFIERKPGYSVSIGLVTRDAHPVIGVILDPEDNRLYTAFRGGGAFCNGEQLRVGQEGKSDVLTVVIDRSSYESTQLAQMTEIAGQVADKCGYASADVFNYGGAAMNAMVALSRAPGCYLKLPRKGNSGGSLWDYGASACIYGEAGAIATDLYGAPLDLNRPDSTYMNHRGFIYATDASIAEALRFRCKNIV